MHPIKLTPVSNRQAAGISQKRSLVVQNPNGSCLLKIACDQIGDATIMMVDGNRFRVAKQQIMLNDI
jgi:hypothetical protein